MDEIMIITSLYDLTPVYIIIYNTYYIYIYIIFILYYILYIIYYIYYSSVNCHLQCSYMHSQLHGLLSHPYFAAWIEWSMIFPHPWPWLRPCPTLLATSCSPGRLIRTTSIFKGTKSGALSMTSGHKKKLTNIFEGQIHSIPFFCVVCDCTNIVRVDTLRVSKSTRTWQWTPPFPDDTPMGWHRGEPVGNPSNSH